MSCITVTLSPTYLYIQYDYLYNGTTYTGFLILNISDGSEVFSSPIGTDYLWNRSYISYMGGFLYNSLAEVASGAGCFSIMSKYVIISQNDGKRFEVWKDGALNWTSPLASAAVSGATTYFHIGLRYDGKYIIAVTDNHRLVCFGGS